jgi:hypothetical protein
MDLKAIFWELYRADTEAEVDKVLNKHKVFSKDTNWKPYGGNKGNFGTFESQQNHPVAALIEKVTNSIDATLIKECKLNGIDPKSSDAPDSMTEAVEKFYGIKEGTLGELTDSERRDLAENIQIIATGDRAQPSLTVFDMGEGQLPENFENTFLSLQKNNKTDIQFVQGKYNMGSTGAVVFCGDKKYQLIASKRHKELNDGQEAKVGFTLVRRHPLSKEELDQQVRSTYYEFFCLDGEIAAFEAEGLDLGAFNRIFTYGSVVKMYSYQLPRGSRSDLTLDLWRDLNQYLYHLPLPLSVYEKRNYAGKTPNKPVLGNETRILMDSRDKVEKRIDFLISKESGLGEIPIQVIVFKSDVSHSEFIKNKSIIFTQNGQVHGSEGQSFISQNLGMSLIKQHTLIHVDCSNIPTEIRQDLFMSNRTHLKQGSKTERLLDEITKLLRGSKELRKINSDRKEALLKDSSTDKEQLEDLLSKLPVDKNVLSLLKKGGNLDFLKRKASPFVGKPETKKKEKKLNRFPSIFDIQLKEDKKTGKKYKTIPLDTTGTVTISTDVLDDYLFRSMEQGEFNIEVLQKQRQTDKPLGKTPSPFVNAPSDALTINRSTSDGNIKLLIKPNEKANVGDVIEIIATLDSAAAGKTFQTIFDVKVDEKLSKPKKKEDKKPDSFPNLPVPKKAYKNPTKDSDIAWSDESLKWTGKDIVKVIQDTSDDGELLVEAIIINMDSFSLIEFISKNRINTAKEITYIKDKYFLSVYFHSLFLFSILQKMRKDDETLQQIEVDEFISKMIKPYANFLLYENYHIEKFAFGED